MAMLIIFSVPFLSGMMGIVFSSWSLAFLCSLIKPDVSRKRRRRYNRSADQRSARNAIPIFLCLFFQSGWLYKVTYARNRLTPGRIIDPRYGNSGLRLLSEFACVLQPHAGAEDQAGVGGGDFAVAVHVAGNISVRIFNNIIRSSQSYGSSQRKPCVR